MSLTAFLHRRSHPSEPRSAMEIAKEGVAEVDEELMFHLRSLVDEELAKGASFDAAWRTAQNRFGSLPHYAEACRDITREDRLMSTSTFPSSRWRWV